MRCHDREKSGHDAGKNTLPEQSPFECRRVAECEQKHERGGLHTEVRKRTEHEFGEWVAHVQPATELVEDESSGKERDEVDGERVGGEARLPKGTECCHEKCVHQSALASNSRDQRDQRIYRDVHGRAEERVCRSDEDGEVHVGDQCECEERSHGSITHISSSLAVSMLSLIFAVVCNSPRTVCTSWMVPTGIPFGNTPPMPLVITV